MYKKFFKSTKINLMFPLQLLNSEYMFLKTKCIIIKYVFSKVPFTLFLNSIKHITNNYYIELKIHKHIKKANTKNRNELCRSTKKPWVQKGLGKARSGSFKSPLWKGGSILFGPVSRSVHIYLKKKNSKLTIFYLLINKRTYVSFVFLTSIIHSFNNFIEHLNQQKRIKGIFSDKIIYILMNDIEYLTIKKNLFKTISSLNISLFLKFDYFIFLI